MSHRLGYASIAGAAVLWAIGATLARRLTDAGIVVVELVASRAWIALAGLALVAAVRRRPRPSTGRIPVAAVLVFGLSLASANFTYYLALSRLPVAVAIVVQYTAPGLVVLWVALERRRMPPGRIVRALALALAGVVLLSELHVAVVRGLTLDGAGLLAAVASAFAFAAYMLSGERVGAALGTERGMLAAFGLASLLWVPVIAAGGVPRTLLEPRFSAGVAFLGVFGTLVPFLLFLWGLSRIEASRAGIVSTLEPLTAAVLAWAWLGQSLSPAQLVGGVLVIAGIAVVQTQAVPAPEVPAPG